MTPREKNIIRMAVSYMLANIDHANDGFANFTRKDPDNMKGNVLVYGKVMPSVSEEEVLKIIKKLNK
jgi:predicted CopG family antitoxin